ncbi:MAG: methyltransferase domain-containing protein [Bacteroidia bacterium]|nr:methyltransferase domain-containing protein [Bacteroidia bacterium]
MISYICFEQTRCLLELGAGKGAVTHFLVEHKPLDAHLYVFELLAGFAQELKQKYADHKNVHIIQDSADKIPYHLPNIVFDYCVSVLPLSIMDKKVVHSILDAVAAQLSYQGLFIQIQYTRRLERLFSHYFIIDKKDYHFFNVPPAHIYIMRKK